MSTSAEHEIVQGPSTTKNSSSSRAPKTGAQLRDNPEEREKCGKTAKNPFIAAITPLLKAAYRSLLHNKMSTDSGDERNLRHLYCWRDPNLSLHDHRTSITAESTRGTNTTCTTGTSATLKERCNCGTFAVFWTLNHGHLSLGQRACQRPCPSTNTTVATVGSQLSSHR